MKKKTMIALMASLMAMGTMNADPSPTPQPDKPKEALADVITSATQTAGQAKDFILSQAPDVVRQLLYWKAAESIIYDLFYIGTLVAIYIWSKRLYPKVANAWEESEDMITGVGGLIAIFVFGIIGIACFFSINIQWLQIWIAPKVYLIEYASKLLHG